ncbi:unnamed protein product [Cuscuta europaea]|uniref:Peptidyl-prolyl cis-trans isomerase CYP38-like PsbQ-like domain-containing protein n=1 Tax=Cuscuta europaea TaxID=41803 RepID=A0A9P1EHP6_CUSEU|nr:unnamed protein product [Cuscuta europaea]
MAHPSLRPFISHKWTVTLTFQPSLHKRVFLSTHCILRFSSLCRRTYARTKHHGLATGFAKTGHVLQDLTKKVTTMSTIPSLSILLDPGVKLETTIAVCLLFVQVACPMPLYGLESLGLSPAKAVLYSPETKLPRTGELALRRAIPTNTSMKAIQQSLEDISYLLRIPQRKPYGTMESNVKKALKIATDEKEAILGSIPVNSRENGSFLYASLIEGKDGLQGLIESIQDKDLDMVSAGVASSLDTVSKLELLQAPGLSFLLPEQYLNYPRLTGRGMVEFTVKKGDGSTFSPEAGGEAKSTAKVQVVLDGYSAPLTAGNFAKLVRFWMGYMMG